MDKVTFSIVGYGRIGMRHAEHIHKQGKLISVCDVDKNALQAAKKAYPDVTVYEHIDDLLKNDDRSSIVNICTPNGLHAEHTLAALNTGKHVVCEKPMALTAEDCRRMIAAAEANERHLFMVMQNRYNPPIRELKKAVDEGRLGKILSGQINCFWNRNPAYYTESPWKGSLKVDGGILFTQFSHFIDLLHWMLGDVESVSVMGDNFLHNDTVEFEDTVVALMRFECGALVTLNGTVNSYHRNMEGSITLFGEKGTAKVGGQYLNVMEHAAVENFEFPDIECKKPPNEYGYYQGTMSNHDDVINNVIQVIRNGAAIDVPGTECLRTVEIIEMIHDACRLKRKG